MSRSTDLLLTAVAPAIWGSTYVVTTLMLPQGYPLTVAMPVSYTHLTLPTNREG